MTIAIRVAIIDGQALFAAGLTVALGSQPGFEILAIDTSLDDMLDFIQRTRPDVILVDIRLPTATLIAKRLHRCSPNTRLVMLAGSAIELQEVPIDRLRTRGWISRSSNRHEFARAIQSIYEGMLYISPIFASVMVGEAGSIRSRSMREPSPSTLTPREAEILGLIRIGLSNRAIAKKAGLHEATVKTYVSRILRKLKVTTRLQAALTRTSLPYA